MDRARLFAQTTCVQLLWIQAEDYLDDPHFADLSEAAKKKRKAPWIHPRFHARRTGGIPTLLPLCYDLPLKLLFASYGARQKELKEHGVYNQARCRVRGWELHETDAVRVKESSDPELIP